VSESPPRSEQRPQEAGKGLGVDGATWLEADGSGAIEDGADAIIAIRYDATEFNKGTTEVLAYGTAV
jgi:hypothetical protein